MIIALFAILNITLGSPVTGNNTIQWSNCGPNLECAFIQVPLDYKDANSPLIKIAINKYAAKGDRLGSLLVNPGGPGGMVIVSDQQLLATT